MRSLLVLQIDCLDVYMDICVPRLLSIFNRHAIEQFMSISVQEREHPAHEPFIRLPKVEFNMRERRVALSLSGETSNSRMRAAAFDEE